MVVASSTVLRRIGRDVAAVVVRSAIESGALRPARTVRWVVVSVDLVVATPSFLDMTVVGLEALPALGEERFAGDLLRSPGGGAITAVAATRLGLRTALVAPLGEDLAGEFVRAELEQEGILVSGQRAARTPQTLVMPFGDDRAMVTVDPGARARAADVAVLEPRAVAANIEQLDIVPSGAHGYITCGDDDARAFARRLPHGIGRMRALLCDRSDALVLTGESRLEDAAAQLAQMVETVVVMAGAHGTLTMLGGRRVDAPDFDTGPAVDTTGDRDLICAAYAWADLGGADAATSIAWACLYSQLAMTVPTATGGAVSEERLLQEGAARGLVPPPRAQRTMSA
jgi:sugar/nucleoside kinase (ribokinase family)